MRQSPNAPVVRVIFVSIILAGKVINTTPFYSEIYRMLKIFCLNRISQQTSWTFTISRVSGVIYSWGHFHASVTTLLWDIFGIVSHMPCKRGHNSNFSDSISFNNIGGKMEGAIYGNYFLF